MTIWKYELQVVDRQTIEMPRGAELLTVQVQGGKPCVWALVDPDAKQVGRIIRTHGTGHEVYNAHRLAYLGTYQIERGALVFHVFEEK